MEKKTYLINLIGAPGAGKSLNAALLFANFKKLGAKAEYVQEYVKDLIYRDIMHEYFDKQDYILEQQYDRFKVLNGKVDFIVTDASLIHNVIYNRMYSDNHEELEKKILEFYSHFNNVNVFVKRGSMIDYENHGRVHSEEEASRIHFELKDLLKELNMEVDFEFNSGSGCIEKLAKDISDFSSLKNNIKNKLKP